MGSFIESLYGNGALLIMWGALLFHLLIPIPPAAHPVRFWQQLARLIASKVNTATSSAQQKQLSGTLALLLMLVPTLLVLIALQSIVWKAEFYHLALLLLALDWRGNETFMRRLIEALAKEDKPHARRLLSTKINRDTNTLSLLGIGKAGAETLLLSYARNVVGVLFWYSLLGGIGALFYRLTLELARNWSPSQRNFSEFGRAAASLFVLLDFVPQRLFSLLVMLGMPVHIVRQALSQSKAWHNSVTGWLICSYAHRFELALGGPAIYQGEKHQRARVGGKIAPSAYHLAQLQKHIAWRIYLWLVLLSLIMFIVHKGF
ncbi:cobalamin biosynthesis family protein [Vibrio hangzhouensis]|uniref:Adenosylcobinamide-phosphate synthase n=1 Tax=Vibrio hangzhouensis TaxID=462991 RepID=A0A1H5XMZ9_9VIBR|nr:cobalamin biosynthesis family protein [Vibrio hangzhouensis]SEG13023.1 adenosylcobinamide-phosphate synthase [Vibrio hangzhouensis]